MQEFHLDIIGTHIRIIVDISSPIGEDFSHIASRLQDFEKKYSRFLEGNWLSLLNTSRQAELTEDARNMLDFSLELARKTDGYFDPTVGKRLTELGYGRKVMSYELGVMEEKSFEDYRGIEVRGDAVILHGNIELEFGGIGKGYMLEWIKNYLSKYERYLIDFGGDIYGRGGWKIGLENPENTEEAIGIIELVDGCFACSSGAKRKWGNHHHLIDPHTGESAGDVLATYIESAYGTFADGYATALCVMPFTLACETLHKTPEIEGVILSKEGNIYRSEGSRCEIFS